MSNDHMRIHREHTDACENITFPQLLLLTVIITFQVNSILLMKDTNMYMNVSLAYFTSVTSLYGCMDYALKAWIENTLL